MKAFTKILALALAMVMIFAMVGCDTENQDNGDTTNPPENGPEYNIGQVGLMKFPIDYRVKTDAKSLNIGDVLTITVSLKTADLADIDATLEISKNDSYEIIGEKSYYTGDFAKDGEYIDLTYQIRITKENYVAEKILLKFSHDSCKVIQEGEITPDYIDRVKACKFCSYSTSVSIMIGGTSSGATSKANLYINNLGFVADSQGVIISRNFEQSKDNAPENLVEIMTESLNREYAAGASIEDLMGRILEFENCGKVFFGIFDSDKLAYAGKSKTDKTYLSKNLRVRVFLPDEKTKDSYPELYDRLGTKGNAELAEEILLVLLERELISQTQYDAELEYLKAIGIANRTKPVIHYDGSSNGDYVITNPESSSSSNGDYVFTTPGSSSSSNGDFVIAAPGNDGNVSGGFVTIIIEKEGTFIIQSYTIDYSKLDFSVPTGDDFYHFVLDLTQP